MSNTIVAPVPRGGRGLKHNMVSLVDDDVIVAPVPRGGRGLKRHGDGALHGGRTGSARPTGRARIETDGRG